MTAEVQVQAITTTRLPTVTALLPIDPLRAAQEAMEEVVEEPEATVVAEVAADADNYNILIYYFNCLL